jgi:hypothetical protein
MTRIYRPATSLEDWRDGLADRDKHWRAGYSAMATAQSWQAANGALPREIARLFDPEPELLFAIPEHKVPLPGGTRDSQCDVFALIRSGTRTIATAIEAKVNEPFGETIETWYQSPTKGRKDRLSALCAWLGLPFPCDPALRYQLLHRTGSAIVEARRFGLGHAAMIVQSFAPDARWIEDFQMFASALGLTLDRDQSAPCRLPCGLELTLGWASGDPMFLKDLTEDGPWTG